MNNLRIKLLCFIIIASIANIKAIAHSPILANSSKGDRSMSKTSVATLPSLTQSEDLGKSKVIDGIFYSLNNEDGVLIATVWTVEGRYGHNFYSGIIDIPSTVTDPDDGKTYTVTSIGRRAFYGQKDMTAVKIPNTVKIIDYQAFTGGCGITMIIFAPNGVLESIEREAFKGCPITSLNFPNSLKTVGEYAFQDCSKLKSIKGGNNIEEIKQRAFGGCINLTEIIFPNSLKKIGNYVFWDCERLQSVTMNEGLELIGDYAFMSCEALENVEFSNTVKEIGFEAFRWCINLKSIEIPNSVETMGTGVFRMCTWLENVKLGNSLKAIPSLAFEQTPLKSIEIPNSVTSIGVSAFVNCPYLTDVTWGNSLESIADNAFGKTNLKTITLPEPLKTIGGGAFAECDSLTQVTLPRSISSITDGAFDYCPQLKTVYCLALTPPLVSYTSWPFKQCDNPVEVHVFEGLKEDYEKNVGWEQGILNNTYIIIDDIPSLKATSITIDNAPYHCNVGEWGQATATILPTDVASNTILWSSSDESILFIDESTGSFYCLEEGIVTITASTTDGSDLEATAMVYIGDVAPLSEQTLTLQTIPSMVYGDENYTLPETTNEGLPLTWASSNSNVAIINGHTLTIKGAGSVSITASQAGNSNYAPFTKGYVLEVAKAPLTITANSYTITQGEPLPAFEATYSGFKNGDDASVLTTQPTLTCDASSDSEPGIYDIIPLDAEANNYDITYITGTLTIIINFDEAIAQLQALVDEAQALYDNSTEGDDIGQYAPGSRAALLAVINSVRGQISSTMSEATISECMTQLSNAIAQFESQLVTPIEDTDYSQIDNTLYIERVEASTGQQTKFRIFMKNTVPIRGFQFSLLLPAGVTAVKTSNGRIKYSFNPERLPEDDAHAITITEQSDGTILFLCGSEYIETFTGNDGEIFSFNVQISEDMNEGNYPIILKNIKLTETDISKYYETSSLKSTLTIVSYIIGDINRDGKVDVSDYIGVANHIMGYTPQNFNMKAADVDVNGVIDVSDYIGIANLIMTGSVFGY